MLDTDTFLTALYVTADDFCQRQPPSRPAPGPKASLTERAESEVITLVIFSQWTRFRSERGFYRYAASRLRPAFPTLPRRSRFNRLTRRCCGTLAAFFGRLAGLLQGRRCRYEALDSSGVPTGDAKRRGWLAGQSDIGWSNRLGWYEGFHLPLSVNPQGVITGFAFAPASARDQTLAGDFFAFRHTPRPRLTTLGAPALGWCAADKGFEGRERRKRRQDCCGGPAALPAQKQQQDPLAQGAAPLAGPGYAKSWKRSLRSSTMPSGRTGSARTGWTAFRPGWPPRPPCTISASGSTGNRAVPPWHLLTCRVGDVAYFTPSV